MRARSNHDTIEQSRQAEKAKPCDLHPVVALGSGYVDSRERQPGRGSFRESFASGTGETTGRRLFIASCVVCERLRAVDIHFRVYMCMCTEVSSSARRV